MPHAWYWNSNVFLCLFISIIYNHYLSFGKIELLSFPCKSFYVRESYLFFYPMDYVPDTYLVDILLDPNFLLVWLFLNPLSVCKNNSLWRDVGQECFFKSGQFWTSQGFPFLQLLYFTVSSTTKSVNPSIAIQFLLFTESLWKVIDSPYMLIQQASE